MEILKKLEEISKSRKTVIGSDGEKTHTWTLTEIQYRWIKRWILVGALTLLTALAGSVISLASYLYQAHKDELQLARVAERDRLVAEDAIHLPETRIALRDAKRDAATLASNVAGLKIKYDEATLLGRDLQTRLDAATAAYSESQRELRATLASGDELSRQLEAAKDRRKAVVAAEARATCGAAQAELERRIKDGEDACAEKVRSLEGKVAQSSSEPPKLKSFPGRSLETLNFVQGDQWRRLDGSLLAVTKVDRTGMSFRTDNLEREVKVNDEVQYGAMMKWCRVRVVKVAPETSPPSAVVEHWCPDWKW